LALLAQFALQAREQARGPREAGEQRVAAAALPAFESEFAFRAFLFQVQPFYQPKIIKQ
jgi:hypothetical protein